MEKLPLIAKNKSNSKKALESSENTGDKSVFNGDEWTNCEKLNSNMELTSESNELVNWLVNIDRAISKGINEPKFSPPAQNLHEAFLEPNRLDYDRTPMMSIHVSDAELFAVEGEFPKSRRMLVSAIDWILSLTAFDIPASVDEKILLLRNCFAPLAVLELCMLAANMSYNSAKLGLSDNNAFIATSKYLTYCFLNSGPVETSFMSLVNPICLLQLDGQEIAMLKAIICFNPEIDGLFSGTIQAISVLSDRVHNALYNHCTKHYVNSNATIRFAKLLRLISKTTTVATQLEQLIQLNHAFRPDQPDDPLIRELLGDICDDRNKLTCSRNSTETSASTSPSYPESPNAQEKYEVNESIQTQ